MLELKDVSKFYYSKNAVASGFNRINLKLKMGEFVAITGESGSGKSTLLNVISGLDSYEEGEMYLNGEETSGYTEKDFEEYRKKYIGNIFQNFNLVNSYTVYQNVELVLLINGYKKRKVKKKILKVLEQVDLLKFRNTKVAKLSGGQKQRVAIARALIKETPIIVADEPTGNLDSESAKNVLELLYKVSKDKLVLIVSHNYEQIEKYTTRKIVMHDGKIIEDKKLKGKEERIEEQTEVHFGLADIPKAQNKKKNIGIINKLRLGFRNTFNIKIKFILLFIVFSFLVMTVMGEYTTYQKQLYEESLLGYSRFFVDTSEERLVIKKSDNSEIVEEDYNELKELENVEYIVENDILTDIQIQLLGSYMGYYGVIKDIELLEDELVYGRMPVNENEIVVSVYSGDYILDVPESVLDTTNRVMTASTGNTIGIYGSDIEVKIVGIAKYDDIQYGMQEFYVQKSISDDIRQMINNSLSTVEFTFNELNYQNGGQFTIIPSDKVPAGEAYVPYEMHYLTRYTNALKYPIDIKLENMYYTSNLNVTISNAYSKYNMTRLLDLSYEDELQKENEKYAYTGQGEAETVNNIYINTQEYYSLFNKGNYQSSVYIKDTELLEETKNSLTKMGYDYIYPFDTMINGGMEYTIIMRAITTVILIIVAIVVFFISYFVIRIILKSRNVYYATIRILGATKRNAKMLLNIELLTVMHLAYGVILTYLILVMNGTIINEAIFSYTEYLKISDMILVYLMLIAISLLISNRYSKKLFKDSAMSTHRNEEV